MYPLNLRFNKVQTDLFRLSVCLSEEEWERFSVLEDRRLFSQTLHVVLLHSSTQKSFLTLRRKFNILLLYLSLSSNFSEKKWGLMTYRKSRKDCPLMANSRIKSPLTDASQESDVWTWCTVWCIDVFFLILTISIIAVGRCNWSWRMYRPPSCRRQKGFDGC